jgi:hypothetical protein
MPHLRRQVFDHSPEIERSMDPDRRGVAVLIDVDKVKGRSRGEPIEMTK